MSTLRPTRNHVTNRWPARRLHRLFKILVSASFILFLIKLYMVQDLNNIPQQLSLMTLRSNYVINFEAFHKKMGEKIVELKLANFSNWHDESHNITSDKLTIHSPTLPEKPKEAALEMAILNHQEKNIAGPSGSSGSSGISSSGNVEEAAKPVQKQAPGDANDTSMDETGNERSLSDDELDLRHHARTQRIRRVCQERGVISYGPIFADYQNITRSMRGLPNSLIVEAPITARFAVASPIRTMGCLVHKVASTSVFSAFLSAIGLKPPAGPVYNLVYLLQPKSIEQFLYTNSTFFKFMFVRHPMDRVLSAYLDKMGKGKHPELREYRKDVKNRGRSIIVFNARRSQNPNISASDALQYNDTSHSSTEDDVPTFEEFLEYVLGSRLQGSSTESHWVPAHRYCTPCTIGFHAVGKLETGNEDFKYVWKKSGLDLFSPIPWKNRSLNSTESKNREKKYYTSLPRDLILRFFDSYRMDFELFDYSINDILMQAGHQPIDENKRPWMDEHEELEFI